MKNMIMVNRSAKSLLPAALALLLALSAGTLFGSGDVLNIPNGARASALGGAMVSVPGSIDNIDYNPAAFASISQMQFTGMLALWALDWKGYYAAVADPVPGIGTVGGSLKYLATSFPLFDNSGNQGRNLMAESLAATVGFGRSFKGKNIGANIKYVFDGYEAYKFHSLAADVGGSLLLAINPRFDLSLGLAVRDIGINIGKNKSAAQIAMPMNGALGGTLILRQSQKYSMNITAEVSSTLADTMIGVAGELGLKKMLFLRGGYTKKLTGAGSLSFGGGLKLPMKKNGKKSVNYDIIIGIGALSLKDQFNSYPLCISVTFVEKDQKAD